MTATVDTFVETFDRFLDDLLHGTEVDDFASNLAAWMALGELRRLSSTCRDEFAQRVGDAMARGSLTVPGVGVVRRRRNKAIHSIDVEESKARILADVLDSRLVDKDTGEVVDETPIDKVRAVWNLPAYSARVTALAARGLDPEDYGEVIDRGWSVSLRPEGGS